MKLLISHNVAEQYTEDRVVMMGHFTQYCARALNIHTGVKFFVVDDRKKYGIETTGVSDDGRLVYVYGKGRAFVDVLRTIAHEMVHVRQHQDGFDKKHDILHFDSELEDEANKYGMALLNAYSEVMGHDFIYEN